MNDLGAELMEKFLNKDLLGYEVGLKYTYHLSDTLDCGPLGPNAGSDTSNHNSGAEGILVDASVAASNWTLDMDNIANTYEVSMIILSILLKALH